MLTKHKTFFIITILWGFTVICVHQLLSNSSLLWFASFSVEEAFVICMKSGCIPHLQCRHESSTPGYPSDSKSITIDRDLFDYLAVHLRDRPYDGVDNYTRFMTAARSLKPFHAQQPLVEGMGPVINDVTSFSNPITINSCRNIKHNEGSRSLLVIVVSAPDHFANRDAIRQTWLTHLINQSNNKALNVEGFGFVVGLTNDSETQQRIQREHELHGDILQFGVVDNYRNLSTKMAAILNWVNSNCQNIDFVLKVDDDVYVNVHNLATVLHSFIPSEPRIYGRATGAIHPSRNDGKWPTDFDMWPWYELPKFLHGAGIVVSGVAIRSLLAAIQTTPYFVWDDVYLTGLCAVKAKLQILASDQMFVLGSQHYTDACFVRQSVMWQTQTLEQMNTTHFVSHTFYREPKIHCTLSNYTLGPNKTLIILQSTIDQPAPAFEFPFRTISQI